MNITHQDRMFWLHKKLPRALRDPKARAYSGIDAVINSHVPAYPTADHPRENLDVRNALSLLYYAGRNGRPERIDFMLEIIRSNHPTSAGRIRYYKRWLRRWASR